MRTTAYTIKYGQWLALLATCILCGCTNGPRQKGIWPWEYGKETGNHQTGDYVTVSGNVGHFGEAPKAAKPVTPESLEPQAPASPPPSGPPAAKTEPPPLLPTVGKPGVAKTMGNSRGKYDFTVDRVKITPPAYVPTYPGQTTYAITAFNHGNAPVSVTIGVNPNSSENLSADKNLPFNAVVPPNTDQALVNFGPKLKSAPYNLRYTYAWSIGDYRASHSCPEHYRFPFVSNIRAYATVGDKANSTPYTRYSVVFSVPAGTPVLAARKGTVVRIKTDDSIDILHDDATIATYSHLENIAEGVFVGKAVAAGEVIGPAGAAENRKEAYLQLTVWRPEPMPDASLQAIAPNSGFDLVSLPLEFCDAESNVCRVLTQDQWVPGNKTTGKKKQAKRRTR